MEPSTTSLSTAADSSPPASPNSTSSKTHTPAESTAAPDLLQDDGNRTSNTASAYGFVPTRQFVVPDADFDDDGRVTAYDFVILRDAAGRRRTVP